MESQKRRLYHVDIPFGGRSISSEYALFLSFTSAPKADSLDALVELYF